MTKKRLDCSNVKSVLKDVANQCGWTLCIGAGTSIPIVPDWYTLVENLIESNCKAADKIPIKKYKELGFSADTMIQAVKNKLRLSDSDFSQLLSDEIYKNIRAALTDDQWHSFLTIHDLKNISTISKKQWDDFKYLYDNHLSHTTANSLAQTVIQSIYKEIPPDCILTFNGEAIFLSLLNYHYILTGKSLKNKFDHVLNSINLRHRNRIPYIHCHGMTHPSSKNIKVGMNATDKLVFSENNYLQLANSSFSWQSAHFIESCLHSKIVFVGVSLTDSNMRKWLSWTHSNKVNELKENGLVSENSTEHFWIKLAPSTTPEKTWTEESVSHLGVRLIWIDSWDQAGLALAKILGLN